MRNLAIVYSALIVCLQFVLLSGCGGPCVRFHKEYCLSSKQLKECVNKRGKIPLDEIKVYGGGVHQEYVLPESIKVHEGDVNDEYVKIGTVRTVESSPSQSGDEWYIRWIKVKASKVGAEAVANISIKRRKIRADFYSDEINKIEVTATADVFILRDNADCFECIE